MMNPYKVFSCEDIKLLKSKKVKVLNKELGAEEEIELLKSITENFNLDESERLIDIWFGDIN